MIRCGCFGYTNNSSDAAAIETVSKVTIVKYERDIQQVTSVMTLAKNGTITEQTSNGSWRQGIKGEMTCTVYVALVWNIIYWMIIIMMIMMMMMMIEW